MRLLTTGGTVLAWDQQGEGPALLLIMGHRYSSRMWRWVLDGLSADHKVIYFDNRGVGESSSPAGPYTIEMLAADAIAVLDAAGASSADVYGMSMGGMIALQMALAYPARVRSLILGCTAPRYPRDTPPTKLNYLQYWLPKRWVARLARKVLYGSVADQQRLQQDLEIFIQDKSDRKGLMSQANAVAGYDASTRLGEIRQPTLVLHGSEDKVVPLAFGRELADGIERSELVVLEGSGHNYTADASEASNKAVLRFLATVG